MKFSISIVSHAQIHLVKDLLSDIASYCQSSSFELILTLNIDEVLPFELNDFIFPVKIIHNNTCLGFGENHNQAFQQATGEYFCVLNPDIRLQDNPFPTLLEFLKDSDLGVVAPVVLNELGYIEDSARFFPTPTKILCKALGFCQGSDYVINDTAIYPEWVAGMFMLFSSKIFKQLGGFDTRFFLYYEDVNLCARLQLEGYKVLLSPKVKVIHQAHRSSHHNFEYFKWHLTSMMRFFCSRVFLQVLWRKLSR